MIGTTVIHCADNANQSSDTITCCHIVAVTGASDVAPATVRVASSPAVITSAPNSGFVPSDRQSFDEGRPHLRCNDEEAIELTMNRAGPAIHLLEASLRSTGFAGASEARVLDRIESA
jgi:hypothetical protein